MPACGPPLTLVHTLNFAAMFSVLLASAAFSDGHAHHGLPCKAEYIAAFADARGIESKICKAVDSFASCASKHRGGLDLADTNELDQYLSSALNAVSEIDCSALVLASYDSGDDSLDSSSEKHLQVDGTDVTGPRMRSRAGGLDIKVARSQDVTFQRIEIETLTKEAVSDQIIKVQDMYEGGSTDFNANLRVKQDSIASTARGAKEELDNALSKLAGLENDMSSVSTAVDDIVEKADDETEKARDAANDAIDKTKIAVRASIDAQLKEIKSKIDSQVEKLKSKMDETKTKLSEPLAEIQEGSGKG